MAVTGRAALAQDEVDRIATWLDEGRSRSWVAERMGISQSGVYYLSIRAGRTTRPAPGPAVNRAGRRRFTPEEDARIQELRMEGLTVKAIGEKVGRGASSVYMRLHALASHAD